MPEINNIPTTQYIGPKIVPHVATPVQWDSTKQYDALSIVMDEGNTYVARYIVPAGIPLSNTNYWVKFASWNAQVAVLQDVVDTFDERIDAVETLVPAEEAARIAADEALQTAIDNEVTARTSADTSLQDAITAEITARTSADTTLQDNIDAEESARIAADNVLRTEIGAEITAEISAEATARTNADAIMQASIDTLEEILPASAFSNINTVQAALENSGRNFGTIDNHYIGRLCYGDNVNNETASCTLLSGNRLLVCAANNKTTNNVDLYTIDLSTYAVTSVVTRTWCHANSVTYNQSEDKIYVSPNWDYLNSSRMYSIYKCNSSTFNTERTYTFEFEPHSVCYDSVSTKTYIVGTPGFSIYELDTSAGTTTLIHTFAEAEVNSTLDFSDSIGGWNDACAYNGHICVMFSGGSGNNIVDFDINSYTYKIFSINRNVGAFVDIEGEGIEFTNHGNIVVCGRAAVLGIEGTPSLFAPIYAIPVYGNVPIGSLTNKYKARATNVYVDGTKGLNYNIACNGQSNSPYPTFVEAYAALKFTNADAITISGDTTIKYQGSQIYSNCSIAVNAGITLTVPTATYFKDIRFSGAATHGIIKKPAGVNMPFKCFGMCSFRQLNFDSSNESTTNYYFVQGRQAIITLNDCDRVNNSNSVSEFRGDTSGIILIDTNSTVTQSGYTGTVYPN